MEKIIIVGSCFGFDMLFDWQGSLGLVAME